MSLLLLFNQGVAAPDTSGQTVLSNHGPGGGYLSKKKWLALVEEMRLEYAAANPSKAPTAIAAVKKARRAAAEAAEDLRLKTDQAEQLARSLAAAESASRVADAIKRAKETLAMVEAIKRAIEEEDEDDIMLMVWAIH